MSAACGIKIPDLRAVGMHGDHWGAPQLVLGKSYTLVREPENTRDVNAVAIKDGHTTKGYITRKDACRLAPIMDSSLVRGPVYAKFHHPAEVVSKKLGPQQMGNIGFKVLAEDQPKVQALLKSWFLNHIVLKVKPL